MDFTVWEFEACSKLRLSRINVTIRIQQFNELYVFKKSKNIFVVMDIDIVPNIILLKVKLLLLALLQNLDFVESEHEMKQRSCFNLCV